MTSLQTLVPENSTMDAQSEGDKGIGVEMKTLEGGNGVRTTIYQMPLNNTLKMVNTIHFTLALCHN